MFLTHIKILVQIIDSHCHIDRVDLTQFGGNVATMIEQSKNLGVSQFLCVSINLEDYPQVLALAKNYAEIYASVGVHPTEQNGVDPDIEQLITLAKHQQVVAIGETGLDYFHLNRAEVDWQRQRFIRHIEAGRQVNKPIIIHMRNAKEDTLAMLKEHQAEKGVMHCFVEDYQTAKTCIDLGFYISLSGIVTFKNAHTVHEVAKNIPLDALLVETDSPYLTPVPHRGKANMPGFTRYVVDCIAQIKKVQPEKVAEATTHNFKKLFLD